MEWLSPNSCSGWPDAGNAIDGNVLTSAHIEIDSGAWTTYLIGSFTSPVQRIKRVRWWGYYSHSGNIVEVDVLTGGSWVNVYSGGWSDVDWTTVNLPQQIVVEAVRIKSKPTANETVSVHEIAVFQEDAPMSERNYKVNEPIEIGYQAPGAETGLTGVVAEIFLPSKAKDLVNFPDVVLTEVSDTGTYRGTYTPNADGVWQVISHKADGSGKVTKSHSVGGHNVHSVGEAVAVVDAAVDAVAADVDTVAAGVVTVDGKADTIITNIAAVDAKVSSQVQPPMAF